MKNAPQLVEKYKSTIAGNEKVMMIHVSLDNSEDAAEGWAAKEQFPWLTILPDDVKRSGMMKYKETNGVPEYALLDKDGERVGSGSGVFTKAVELTSDET